MSAAHVRAPKHAVGDWATRFLTHDELRGLLLEWQERCPRLLSVEAIGSSPEGREILLATVHDSDRSPAETAPGLWVDANIHATEVTASAAALHLIWSLLDPNGTVQARRARERRTIYVVPRQNPDGAELALASKPALYRSRPAGPQSGAQAQDIDDDGRVLLMRVPDRNGWWCQCEREPRLIRPRLPHEDPAALECYDVLPEGLVSAPGDANPPSELDLNRNYPYRWRGEDEQPGAGPAPSSEPEVRSVIEAILTRANIGAYLSYHTFGGVHLTPFGDDGELDPGDRERYRALAEIATMLTGYPTAPTLDYWGMGSVYGTSDDWIYDQRGVLAWTTEFWNPLAEAGVRRTLPGYWAQWREEDELALLEWSDRSGDGRCFVDWYRFDHPQLGPVELGGWDQFQLANPPPSMLRDVLAGHEQFATAYALTLPELELSPAGVDRLGGDTWKIAVTVENAGWLPTAVTDRATARDLCDPVTCRLEADEAVIAIGAPVQTIGQLSGAPVAAGVLGDYQFPYGGPKRGRRRAAVSFVVRAPAGGSVRISADHPRAGRATVEVALPEGAP